MELDGKEIIFLIAFKDTLHEIRFEKGIVKSDKSLRPAGRYGWSSDPEEIKKVYSNPWR